MLQQQVLIINSFLMIIDAICIIVAGYTAYYLKYLLSDGKWTMDTNVFLGSVLLILFVNNYVMGRFRLYGDTKSKSILSYNWCVIKSIIIDFSLLSACIFVFKIEDYSRFFLFFFAVFCFIFVSFQRILSQFYINRQYKKSYNIRKILIVGSSERLEVVLDFLSRQLSWGHEVVGRISPRESDMKSTGTLGSIKDLPFILRTREVDEVFFALDSNKAIDLMEYIRLCKKMGILVRILPALWQNTGDLTISVEKCQGMPFITIQGDSLNATGLLYKRMLDIFGGVIGIVLFVLIYPFVAAAIKIDSPGPVLFRQKRVGQHGRIFKLYKFRSMVSDAEQKKIELLSKNNMNGAIFKIKDDPRITRVGKWLRKTSLDEFPQFINVLKGEMSLVGTRPPTPDEVENYQIEHLKRIAIKPGITGLWQISGRNQIVDFDQIVELDCRYLDKWRFFDDIKILFKTIMVVLHRKGAL